MKLLLPLLLIGFTGFAQITETLDRNNTSFVTSNTGVIIGDPQNNNTYEFPEGSGNTLLNYLSFWFAGYDNSDVLHAAGEDSFSNPGDYEPGPYSANAMYQNATYINKYSQGIWKVSREEIDAHILEYQMNGAVANPIPAILTWPANGDTQLGVNDDLAPFVDQNNDGIYDPFAGDHPVIKGCEAIYIILNDDANTSSGQWNTPNIGLELHIMFYQYNTNNFLNDVTFVDLRAINRGTFDYQEMRIGQAMDADVGDPTDDYMGTEVTRKMVYTWNGNLSDQEYGAHVPAIGLKCLNQNVATTKYFTDAAIFPTAYPINGLESWYSMGANWSDGSPVFYGGNAYNTASTTETTYIFPADSDPTGIGTMGAIIGADWAEYNGNSGSPNPPGNRRTLMSQKEFNFLSGSEFDLHFAIIVGREMTIADPWESVERMGEIADSVELFYGSGSASCYDVIASLSENELNENEIQIYPNPSSGTFHIDVNELDVNSMRILDMQGRVVLEEQVQGTTSFEFNGPEGMYFVNLIGSDWSVIQKIQFKY